MLRPLGIRSLLACAALICAACGGSDRCSEADCGTPDPFTKGLRTLRLGNATLTPSFSPTHQEYEAVISVVEPTIEVVTHAFEASASVRITMQDDTVIDAAGRAKVQVPEGESVLWVSVTGHSGSIVYRVRLRRGIPDVLHASAQTLPDRLGRSVVSDGTTIVAAGALLEGATAAPQIELFDLDSLLSTGTTFDSDYRPQANPIPPLAIDIQGDTLAVGALEYDFHGRVHIFKRIDNVWVHQHTLFAPDVCDESTDPIPGQYYCPDGFGSSVLLDGDRLFVGAPLTSDYRRADPESLGGLLATRAGAIFEYARSDEGWNGPIAHFSPTEQRDGMFGTSMALAGNTLIVGASIESTSAVLGEGVHIIDISSGAWRDLLHDDHINGSHGLQVDIEGNLAVAGRPFNADSAGAVEIYRRVDDAWSKIYTLQGPARFGTAVSLYRGRVVVGAPGMYATTESVWPGSVHVFEEQAGEWQETVTLRGERAGDGFGVSLHNGGDHLLVGAWGVDSVVENDVGAVYLYR